MASIAVVPGSFDPLTKGHLDVITRAAKLFDRVKVLVVHNPDKNPMLSASVRQQLIAAAISEAGLSPTIEVEIFSDGLLVDYCKKVGAKAVVKGVRSQFDVGYEIPMVLMNRSLAEVETVFLLPDPAYSLVSSSLVRQVYALNGDVSEYVPQAVWEYLQQIKAGAQ